MAKQREGLSRRAGVKESSKDMTKDKRRTLYEFEWQLLRISLDFSTISAFEKSKEAIELYLKKHNYRPRAAYKVINLMAAVSMGLHSPTNSAKPAELVSLVQKYRESLSVGYTKGDKSEDWSTDNEVRRRELKEQQLQDIHKVKQNLTLRWVKHSRGPLKYRKTRPELEEYIHMLEEELIDRAHSTLNNQGTYP